MQAEGADLKMAFNREKIEELKAQITQKQTLENIQKTKEANRPKAEKECDVDSFSGLEFR